MNLGYTRISTLEQDNRMNNAEKSRREFLRGSGKVAAAAALFGATGSMAYAAPSTSKTRETDNRMIA